MTTSSEPSDQSAAAGCDAARQLREAALPLPRGSEQSREEIATVIAAWAWPWCPYVHLPGNFQETALKVADAILALLSTAHAEGLGKEEEYGVQTHVEPQHYTGWRPTHRHVTRGTEYEYLGWGRAQCSPSGLLDDEHVAIYRGEGGDLWARRLSEFSDGRFELLSIEEQSSQSEPQASAGNAGLDELSLALARQRELETERDEWKNRAHGYELRLGNLGRDLTNAETRVRELEEALRDREKLGELIYLAMYSPQGAIWAANDSKPVWFAAADRLAAALLSPKTGGDHE